MQRWLAARRCCPQPTSPASSCCAAALLCGGGALLLSGTSRQAPRNGGRTCWLQRRRRLSLQGGCLRAGASAQWAANAPAVAARKLSCAHAQGASWPSTAGALESDGAASHVVEDSTNEMGKPARGGGLWSAVKPNGHPLDCWPPHVALRHSVLCPNACPTQALLLCLATLPAAATRAKSSTGRSTRHSKARGAAAGAQQQEQQGTEAGEGGSGG